MKKIIFVLCTFALLTLFFACKVEDAGATEAKKYTVTIETNGGDGISDKAPTVEEGGTLTLTNPTKTGYVFKGWSTTNKLDNLNFTSGNTKVTSDITIYAMFNKLYNVVINTNGATPATITKQVEEGTKVTLATSEIPTKTAYTLSGYKDGNSVAFDIATQAVNSDLNLTMQWSVDLAAIRDILTGGTTTGKKWYGYKIDTTTNLPEPVTDGTGYFVFKTSTAASTALELSFDYIGFIYAVAGNNSTSFLIESDNPAYIAKFKTPLAAPNYAPSVAYIVSITKNFLILHYDNNSIDDKTYYIP